MLQQIIYYDLFKVNALRERKKKSQIHTERWREKTRVTYKTGRVT